MWRFCRVTSWLWTDAAFSHLLPLRQDIPRLNRQKAEARWEKYPVKELRGATLGIIGSVSSQSGHSTRVGQGPRGIIRVVGRGSCAEHHPA